MRRRHIIGYAAILVTGAGLWQGWCSLSGQQVVPALAPIFAADAVQPAAGSAPLVVHEWGTFTSFSGSDGVKLEFRPLEERDLPGFVLHRASLATRLLNKASLPAIQRMETPVTYFYTPVERDVTVRVAFPQGLLTEFYPPVRSLGPKLDALGDANPVVLKDSWLDWGRVHLIPPESLRAAVQDAELSRRIGRHVERTMTPEAGKFPHYAAARETDSAIVQSRHRPQTGASGAAAAVLPGDYFEKFLFYRGIGNFDLPLTLTAHDEQSFTLVNSGTDEVRSLYLVTVHGEAVSYRKYPSVAAGGTLNLKPADRATALEVLESDVCQALVAEGLYEKEALAMLNVWKTSWFGEEGTRLFYIVPERLTEELLPLQISPQPTELVRVLVGRMEIMTPKLEQEILELVRSSAAVRDTLAKGSSSPQLPALTRLGRLGEPALVRAGAVSDSVALQEEARRLMEELRVSRAASTGG